MRIAVFFFCALASLAVFGQSAAPSGNTPTTSSVETVRYRIDPSQSKFMVVAPRGGLLWFKGHSHYIAVRDFEGDAEVTLNAVTPASLQMAVRAASLEETGADFTPEQKGIIKKELEEIVLETAKYPEIHFKSTAVQGKLNNGALEVEITGDLTLHGVTRRIEIPATVTVSGDTFHAVGKFAIDRKKFNVKATNAFHGLVRVKHGMKFTFDIIGRRVA